MSRDIDAGLLRKNKRIFRSYSRLRRESAQGLNREKASVAFEIIPVLLSLNEKGLPGYVPGGEEACGVYGMNSAQDLKKAVQDYFPETANKRIAYQGYIVRRPVIESLFTMGSIGTVAQTGKSDFDFWVCLDGAHIRPKGMERLREKTEEIAAWCQKTFDMEVHFFLCELEQIRRNDFGSVDEESTGSSQKNFLKEECYRTMLLVAGKIPLWWVLPPETTEDEYDRYREWLDTDTAFESNDFVDLGFLSGISREEFLGTALWNLSKATKDPFKALIKMAVMERYLSDGAGNGLLCNAVKDRVLGGCTILRDMDPYLLPVETVLDFYRKQERLEHLELLRTAFYIKCDPGITRMRLKKGRGDYKLGVFEELMEKWGWSLEAVEDLNQMENWSYARHLKFSNEINRFFFSTYRGLSNILRDKERQAINDVDLTLLGRKIFSLFSKKESKVPITPFLTSKRLTLERCIFQYARDKSGRARWFLYDGTRYPMEKDGKKVRIFASERIVRAAAWLVMNGLYEPYATVVEMPSNPSGVTVNDLIDLIKHLQGFFLPAAVQFKMGANLSREARPDRIMVVVDMEASPGSGAPTGMDLVFTTTWAEMFTLDHGFQEGLSAVKEQVAALRAGDSAELASRIKIHVPKSMQEMDEKRRIYQAMLQGLVG